MTLSGDRLGLAVTDGCPAVAPRMRDTPPGEERGYGLHIVDYLSTAWAAMAMTATRPSGRTSTSTSRCRDAGYGRLVSVRTGCADAALEQLSNVVCEWPAERVGDGKVELRDRGCRVTCSVAAGGMPWSTGWAWLVGVCGGTRWWWRWEVAVALERRDGVGEHFDVLSAFACGWCAVACVSECRGDAVEAALVAGEVHGLSWSEAASRAAWVSRLRSRCSSAASF
jgi:hypothetical protein